MTAENHVTWRVTKHGGAGLRLANSGPDRPKARSLSLSSPPSTLLLVTCSLGGGEPGAEHVGLRGGFASPRHAATHPADTAAAAAAHTFEGRRQQNQEHVSVQGAGEDPLRQGGEEEPAQPAAQSLSGGPRWVTEARIFVDPRPAGGFRGVPRDSNRGR